MKFIKYSIPIITDERDKAIYSISHLKKNIKNESSRKNKRLLKKKLDSEKEKLIEIDILLGKLGVIPINQRESLINNDKITNEINCIKTSIEMKRWVRKDWPQKAKHYLEHIDFSNKNIISFGKWLGEFESTNPNFPPGEFIFGYIQIDNKFIGKGTLLGSIYSIGYFYGLIDYTEIRLEIFNNEMPIKTFYNGFINRNKNEVFGIYNIEDGTDKGTIKAAFETNINSQKYENTIERNLFLNKLRLEIKRSNIKQVKKILNSYEKKFTDNIINPIDPYTTLKSLISRYGEVPDRKKSKVIKHMLVVVNNHQKEIKMKNGKNIISNSTIKAGRDIYIGDNWLNEL